MAVTAVFSSATALLSSDFISNFPESDLDALLTKLRWDIGIEIITNTESISIAGKWTSVLEAHAILRESISKTQSIFDAEISKSNERNDIIRDISNKKERSTTWLENEISDILELQKHQQALEVQIENHAPSDFTAKDFSSGNEESSSNNTQRRGENCFILKDIDRSLKYINTETYLEKQKKDTVLDHTCFKYSNECEKNSVVTGDSITSCNGNREDLILENSAKEITQSAFLGDENDQVLCHQTQTERTATAMEPVGSVIKGPFPTSDQFVWNVSASGSYTRNTIHTDTIHKDQKKSPGRNKTFEGPNNMSFKEIRTINNFGTFPIGGCGSVGESQIRQQRVKQDGIILICDQCDRNFCKENDLNEHRKNEHNLLPVHESSRCKSISQTVGTFLCHECDYIGKSEQHIREHWVRAHCQVFKCTDCGKLFGQNAELEKHRQRVHDPARVCEYCDKSFRQKGSYNSHLASHHKDEISQLYTCDTCNIRRASMINLVSHIEKVHLGIIPARKILCDICGKNFLTKQSYDKHKNIHSDVKLYQCNTCKKRFSTKQGYQDHIVTHTDRVKHKCEICSKAYFDKRYLQLHKNASHNDGQRHSFQCKICGRKCLSYSGLRTHQKIHANLRDHVCNICGKDFTHVTSLQRHQRIHSDDKPYSCSFCKKTSTDVSVIRRHVMIVHKKDPQTWQEAVVKSLKLQK